VFGTEADADQARGNSAKKGPSREKLEGPAQSEGFRTTENAADHTVLNNDLKPLGRPCWKRSPFLDGAKITLAGRSLQEHGTQNICCGYCVLNGKIDANAADWRHGVGRVANAQESRPPPTRQPVDSNGQEANVLPIAQFIHTIAQEGCERCNLLAERWEASLANLFGCAFRDYKGTLPIGFAIERGKNSASLDVAEGLSRVTGAAA